MSRRSLLRGAPAAAILGLVALALPAPVAAHTITGRYASPIPLWAYLAGAGVAVALSFALVLSRPVAVALPAPGRVVRVPLRLRQALRVVGVAAWLLVAIQWLLGGVPGVADAASLFLWIYGWVGLALLSAFVGPVWSWLDPFSSLADTAGWIARRVGLPRPQVAPYPARLGRWPAVAGYAYFLWLELAVTGGGAGPVMGASLVGYTLLTLLGMLVYGRDTWRAQGETFGVWFGLLGRLAPLALEGDPGAGTVRRRRYADGLRGAPFASAELALVALATSGVIFDGLSQTTPFFDLFGTHSVGQMTVLLALFTGTITALVLLVSRWTGRQAMGAGLVPIAAGYIVAHYLTYVLIDGQRFPAIINDPFQVGWHLLGFSDFDPIPFLAAGVVWAFQLAAVVGGHVVGAITGHAAAADRPAVAAPVPSRGRTARRQAAGLAEAADPPPSVVEVRRRQAPLAVLMVGLTVLTLWSLGQEVVRPTTSSGAVPAAFVEPA